MEVAFNDHDAPSDMERLRRYPFLLFLLASLAVSILLLASDLAPREVGGFQQVTTGEGKIQTVCVVANCRTTDKGYLLNLTDSNGSVMGAFCPRDVVVGPLDNGSVVRVVGEVSPDDLGFLFIGQLTVLSSSTANRNEGGKR